MHYYEICMFRINLRVMLLFSYLITATVTLALLLSFWLLKKKNKSTSKFEKILMYVLAGVFFLRFMWRVEIENEIAKLTDLKNNETEQSKKEKIDARITQLEKLQPANEDQANVNEKVKLLTNAVASIVPDASYADGKYSNIYIYNGMGAMIQMYPKTNA